MSPTASWPGARWLRCDVHVHTPLDPSRTFGEDVAAALHKRDKGDDAPLRVIAFRMFDACRDAGLDLVVFTDHNGVEGYRLLTPFLDEWRRDRDAELTVLPGVEVSVGAERVLHVLLVAGIETSAGWLDEYLTILFKGNHRFNGQQPLSCGLSLQAFIDCSRDCFRKRGAPYLLIPAHINRGSGIDRELRSTTEDWIGELKGWPRFEAFAQEAWAGFQVSGDASRVPQVNELLRRWAAAFHHGKPLEWLTDAERADVGRTHWPLLHASDPKRYEDIGRRFSHLKMECPSLEGLRLALLDPESRLRTMEEGEPPTDHPWITSLSVRHTDFFESVDVRLNPNLNVVIGGRGTGKSSLVELLRHGLGRTRPEDFVEEESEVRERVERLLRAKPARDSGQTPGMLLPDHEITVGLVVANRSYRITQDAGGLRVAADDDDVAGLNARALLDPRILSQGQIAQIGRDRAAQRRELDALEEADQLQERAAGRRANIEKLVQAQGRRSALLGRYATLGERQTELRRVRDQIEMLEREGSKQLLDRYRGYRAEGRWIDDSLRLLSDVSEAIAQVAEQVMETEATAPPDHGPSLDWTTGVREQVQEALDRARGELLGVAERLLATQTAVRGERDTRWLPGRDEVEQHYAELRDQLSARGTSFDAHAGLLQRRSLLERDVERLRQLPGEISDAQVEVTRVRNELVEWHRQRAANRSGMARTLADQDADVRLEVLPFGDREDLERQRAAWFGGSGLQDRDWRVLCDFVYAEPEEAPTRLALLVSALRQDVGTTAERGAAPAGPTATQSLLGAAWDNLSGHFSRALERYDVGRLDEAERFLPNDEVRTRIRDASGTFKPIEQGSLGQRNTAVLSLLLAAQREPLVIDQPEEDLDNQYVYDVVVDLIRKRKFLRQLILVTHNANIPVNGDAELIIRLGVRDALGYVQMAGSIDRPDVKEQVSLVMEGSAEAFRLRRQRYGY